MCLSFLGRSQLFVEDERDLLIVTVGLVVLNVLTRANIDTKVARAFAAGCLVELAEGGVLLRNSFRGVAFANLHAHLCLGAALLAVEL